MPRPLLRVAWLMIWLLVLAGPVRGQGTVVVSGTVADAKTHESLLGATVRLSRAGVAVSASPEGFVLTCPRAARPDTLVVTYVGYRAKRLVVVPQANMQLTILLAPLAQLELAQVEVTAKKPIAEDFVIQQLDFLQIVTNPAAAADPLLAVRTLPSSSTTDESANISLRGSDPSQTGIYLDNAPVYDAVKLAQVNGLGTFSIFNPSLIKSLLVFPSNPPLEFGNAGAGLIAVDTDDKRQARNLEVNLGLANSGLFAGLPVRKRGMLKCYGNFQSGKLLRLLNPRAFADLGQLRLSDAGLHYALRLGPGRTLRVFGYGISERYAFQYASPSVNEAFQSRKNRGLLVTNYGQAFAKADLNLTFAGSHSLAHSAVGNYRLRQGNTDWFGSAAYRYYWSDQFSTRAGISFDQRTIGVAGQFPRYDYALSASAPSITDSLTRRRALAEIYQYTKLNLGQWVFGVGLRHSLPGTAFRYVSYQGNARYNFNKEQFINLAGGQYNTVITPNAAQYPFQLTTTRQLALDYSYSGRNWVITAALYAKRERGLFNARILGAEVYGQHQLGNWLRADLSVASLRARTSDALVNGLLYTSTQRDLPFTIKSSWQFTTAWLNLGLVVQYRSGVPYLPVISNVFDKQAGAYQPLYAAGSPTSRLPTYFRTDLSANKIIKFGERNSLLLYATLNNIFNINNVSYYAYNSNYSEPNPVYFQLRLLYLGLVLSLQ